jgi:hypothetical protein
MYQIDTFNTHQRTPLVNGIEFKPQCMAMGILIDPIVEKVGGPQSQGAKDVAAVNLLQILGNAGSGALRLSRRGKKMA